MKRRTFIQTLILSSGYISLNPGNLYGREMKRNDFMISMIYNNIGSSVNLKSAWGLSVWIETEKTALMFDTGGDTSIIWKNIVSSNLDINKLSKIVISHEHWDHRNGLEVILEKTSYKPDIFIIESDYSLFNKEFPNAKIKSLKEPTQIDENIWTTGELVGNYGDNSIAEHSIILTQKNSVVLLTGCSHSGIVEMVKRTKQLFPDKKIELVAGGFHLGRKSEEEIVKISDDLKKLNIRKIAPSHCTGDKAIDHFRNNWGEKFIDLNLGDNFKI